MAVSCSLQISSLSGLTGVTGVLPLLQQVSPSQSGAARHVSGGVQKSRPQARRCYFLTSQKPQQATVSRATLVQNRSPLPCGTSLAAHLSLTDCQSHPRLTNITALSNVQHCHQLQIKKGFSTGSQVHNGRHKFPALSLCQWGGFGVHTHSLWTIKQLWPHYPAPAMTPGWALAGSAAQEHSCSSQPLAAAAVPAFLASRPLHGKMTKPGRTGQICPGRERTTLSATQEKTQG